MKKLRLLFLSVVAVAISSQVVTAHGWHQKGNKHHDKTEQRDSVADSTYHHKNHHHTDSIDYDSLYNDSVLIYHHGHHHFKNDTISYDSLRHDSLATHKHDSLCHKKNHNDWNNHNQGWNKHEVEPDTFYVNNVLYIDSMTVAPGTKSVVLPIVLDNKDVVRSFSFRVSLPDGIEIAKDSLGNVEIAADTARLNADLYIQKTKHDELIFQFWKHKGNTISGNSGAVAYLTVNLADTLTAGDYTMELTGVQMTDQYNQKHRGYTSCTALTIAPAASKKNNFDEGTANGIATVNTTTVTKSSAYYDLNGRQVATPKAGDIYIHNGKKMIQK